MRHAYPEAFLLLLPWALFCLLILVNQSVALAWLKKNVSTRFLGRFTRYRPATLWLHAAILFAAGASLIWALAAPHSYGDVAGGDAGKSVFFIIDASYSMFAQDMGNLTREPWRDKTRFEAAKAIAAETALKLENDRVGLVTFSGSSVTHFSPTPDLNVAAALIENAGIHSMRHTGSDFSRPLDDLIHAALSDPGQYAAVLLSDGEPQPDDQDLGRQLEALGAAGIPVFTVGLGLPEGASVDLYEPEDVIGFVENPRVAKSVWTRRNDDLLRRVAETTGGEFFVLENGLDVPELTRALAAVPILPEAAASRFKAGAIDRSALPLTLFLVLFCAEIAFLFPRNAGFAALLSVLLCQCQSRLYRAHRENESGIDKYDVSLFDKAKNHFETSSLYRTREEIPLLNLGNNALQMQEYTAAHTAYQQAIRADPEHPDASFNDGVALFLWAESEVDPKGCFLGKAAELYDQSIDRFLEADKKGRDAQSNIAYIKKRIRDMYELQDAAKDCPPADPSQSYTSKHAPQKQNQQQQQQSPQPQQQNQQQQQSPQPQQQNQQQQQSPQPQQQNQQQQQAQGKAQKDDPNSFSEEESRTAEENLRRIKQESQDAKDFKQTREQQRPTDKSEIDEDLYW